MDSGTEVVAHNGFCILMEMASAPAGLSRSALKARCGFTLRKLDDALALLTRSGLIERPRGPRGRYSLSQPPEQISVDRLQQALGRLSRRDGKSTSRAGASSLRALLADLDRNSTLAELSEATASIDEGLCPYYDACVALGGPEGPAVTHDCRGRCI